jgi:acetyltransferase-like isoleucine patch superfamily enzyme
MSLQHRPPTDSTAYSAEDTARKGVYVLIRWVRTVFHFFSKIRFWFFTKCWAGNVLGHVYFDTICHNMSVGKYATFYPNTVLELAENATLRIGDNFTLSYGAIIACRSSVTMGNFVMIGEYTSIRDTTHGYEPSGLPYSQQPDSHQPIIIGNNVWIGKGCIILPGTVIEDGVIVGAHSVVKGHLKASSMYAGAPVKLIREITSA